MNVTKTLHNGKNSDNIYNNNNNDDNYYNCCSYHYCRCMMMTTMIFLTTTVMTSVTPTKATYPAVIAGNTVLLGPGLSSAFFVIAKLKATEIINVQKLVTTPNKSLKMHLFKY